MPQSDTEIKKTLSDRVWDLMGYLMYDAHVTWGQIIAGILAMGLIRFVGRLFHISLTLPWAR